MPKSEASLSQILGSYVARLDLRACRRGRALAHAALPLKHMPHSVTLITTIAVSFGLALLMGLIANRLKLPVLVGYLTAGVILGSNTPGFVADIELSGQLAEIGVILLMFGVGLHFSLNDLLAVRRIALPGAIVQIVVATILGAIVAHAWGWNTGCRHRIRRGAFHGEHSRVAAGAGAARPAQVRQWINRGWLAGGRGSRDGSGSGFDASSLGIAWEPTGGAAAGVSGSELFMTLLLTFGKVAIFVALMLIVGKRVFPWLLWHVASTNSNELFILSVIAVAIGIAYGSAMLFGVSFALGAFFAGMVMRESELSHRAAQESLPLRDAFSVLFFVSVGMLFDPNVLIDQPLRVIATLAIIIIGKSLAAVLFGACFPLSIKYGAHGFGQPCADRRVFIYSGSTGCLARAPAGRGPEPYRGRSVHLDYTKSAGVPCDRTGPGLDTLPFQSCPHSGALGRSAGGIAHHGCVELCYKPRGACGLWPCRAAYWRSSGRTGAAASLWRSKIGIWSRRCASEGLMP